MKTHTTNYTDTFIEIAPDSKAVAGEIPPVKGDKKTIAGTQFDMLSKAPYKYTSDDVLFGVFAEKNHIDESELHEAREQFFSKGQACMRASPLTKKYGWGIHSNAEGKIALYGCETKEYEEFSGDKSLKILKAMRSAK